MKRLLGILTLSLLTFSMDAGSPYFSTREGMRMHYERRNASNGNLVWTYDAIVDKVHDDGLDFTYDFHRPGGGQMYGGPLKLRMDISPDGDITVDVAATMKTYVHNIFPKVDVWSDGEKTLLPASMKPGDGLPDVTAKAKVLGLNYVVSYTGREVLRRESLETGAGVFDAVVVQEHKKETGLRNREVRTLTWYIAGIGVGRHETYDWKTGKLLTIETLESIE